MAKKISEYFKEQGRKMWKFDETRYKGAKWMTDTKRLRNATAALIHNPDKTMTLEINKKGWRLLNNEQKKQVLTHEAIHIGHHRHDSKFDMLAEHYGTQRTVAAMMGKTYKVVGFKDGKQIIIYENKDWGSTKMWVRYNRHKLKGYDKVMYLQ